MIYFYTSIYFYFAVDSTMPSLLVSLLQRMFSVTLGLLLIVIVYHFFVIPFLLLGGIFIILQKMFRVAINDLRRFDNITRSPIFTHVSATVQGLSVIRAFQKQDEFYEKYLVLSLTFYSFTYLIIYILPFNCNTI